jgi:membrane protein implicated in regulation of membrane protease activity
VIVLAVIILLLLGGVAYLSYFRSVFWAHMYLSYHWPSDSYFLQLILCLVKFLVSLALWHERVHKFSNPQLTVFIVQ